MNVDQLEERALPCSRNPKKEKTAGHAEALDPNGPTQAYHSQSRKGDEVPDHSLPYPGRAQHEKLPTTKGKREQVLICIPTFMLRLDYPQQRAG